MNLLVRNGRIVTAAGEYQADVLCEEEVITRIGASLPRPGGNCRVLDAGGKLVFPGFIDPHVHVYLPASGTFATDDHISASTAALLGGTTCFLEFVLPERQQSPLAALDLWRGKARESLCDYSFHMAVTRFDDTVARELEEVIKKGITSFKVHLAYKDVLNLTEEELYRLLRFAAERNVLVVAHCENADIIELRRKQLWEEGKRAMRYHYETRPPLVEGDGTHHFLSLAVLCGCPAYVAHLSCREALEVACHFRQRYSHIFIETLIQFLLLDRSYTELPPEEAVKYIMSPPLRNPEDREALWQALRNGVVDTVGTDHAPFNLRGQKDRSLNDFTRVPNGLPGIQDRVRLLYTHGVAAGRISANRFVEAAATAPARIFGLYPRKGTIQVGSDADLVIFDPDEEDVISASTHAMKVDYSAYEGWKVRGRVEYVILRGEVVVEQGRILARPGYGRFVPRRPQSYRPC